jgi:uncharacterized protein
MDLAAIFITGLTIGGLTCLAVQGGLLASVIASREQDDFRENNKSTHTVIPVVAFIFTKLIAYTIVGFLLGLFGSVLSLSQSAQIIMQTIAALYMIAVALNLLNVHPIFRYAVIQPPKFITKKIKDQSRSKDIFAPAMLGVMTIFIPCGTTLAMEALAITSANPISGALIMAVFVLGTIPMFFGLGYITTKMGDIFKSKFLKIASLAILFLGVSTLNNSLVAAGSPITFQNLTENIVIGNQTEDTDSTFKNDIKDGFQLVSIDVKNEGHYPSKITLHKGVPTKLTLVTENIYSCSLAFRIPHLKMGINLKPTDNYVLELPAMEKGKYTYSCSMGMYRGVIEVR